ncbi:MULTISPECIES: hypothetical protein [unclassified Adlercreutzia]|uniref:CdiA C-terminal domain-containing protein n=1 Tax=unclassified Adlercreutzia TaxID=2636013 RepID=UPI0013EA95E0|nr:MULTISPECIES: hypothetical protein [unclassified Adlercreutzia]
MQSRTGKIIVPPDANVWPHEMETARALAKSGLIVEFIRRSEEQHVASADVLIDGVKWEMKAPTSSSMKSLQRNLHKALHQSPCVIIDSRRMKGVPDRAIEHELRMLSDKFKNLRRLKLVNRQRKVLDIK